MLHYGNHVLRMILIRQGMQAMRQLFNTPSPADASCQFMHEMALYGLDFVFVTRKFLCR